MARDSWAVFLHRKIVNAGRGSKKGGRDSPVQKGRVPPGTPPTGSGSSHNEGYCIDHAHQGTLQVVGMSIRQQADCQNGSPPAIMAGKQAGRAFQDTPPIRPASPHKTLYKRNMSVVICKHTGIIIIIVIIHHSSCEIKVITPVLLKSYKRCHRCP